MSSQRPDATGLMSRRRLMQLTAGSTLALALSACASPIQPAHTLPSTGTDQTPQPGGIFRFAMTDALTMFDPARWLSAADLYLAAAVYEGLVAMDTSDPTFPIVSRLAESWEVSADGLEWIFHLRAGVTFHHGTPFTAKDVVYTFTRIQDPALAASGLARLAYVETVEAIDDGSPQGAVRFRLNSPVVTLLVTLADPLAGLWIVPHDLTNDALTKQASGTAPFHVASYQPGERLVLKRNEQYWDPQLPYLDEIQHLYIPDNISQVVALTSGTIDAMILSNANAVELQGNPDIQILPLNPGLHDGLVMRPDQPPFDDVRIRQAFKVAIDRAGLLQIVAQGQGYITNDQPIAPISPFWADLPIPQQDFPKAKALLAEAGYPDGLEVTLVVAEIWPGLTTAAVAIQDMVKPAGITITLQPVSVDLFWGQYFQEAALFMGYWSSDPDPDIVLSSSYHSHAPFNDSGWQNPALDALIEAGRIERDPAQRKAIYAEAQQLIQEQGCIMIPYHRLLLFGARANVQNLREEFSYSGARDVWMTAVQ